MTRCTTCRSEIDDDDDAMPLCTDCKGDPEMMLDRDALDVQYQTLVCRKGGREKASET